MKILVRPGSRDKITQFETLGAQIVEGAIGPDAGKALASLCQGVSTVISAVQGGPDVIIDRQTQLLRVARDAGVNRFIPSDYSLDLFKVTPGHIPTVAKSLLERGHEVRAVTRNPDSAKAEELANAGATLVRASLEDTATLTRALEGATSLFEVTTPVGGTDAETRQGVSAAEAAKAAGGASRLHIRRVRQSTDGYSALRKQVRGRKAHRGDRRAPIGVIRILESFQFAME